MVMSSDIGSPLRDQKGNHFRHFLGRTNPSQGNCAIQLIHRDTHAGGQQLAALVSSFGFDRTRRYQIDPYTSRSQLSSQ